MRMVSKAGREHGLLALLILGAASCAHSASDDLVSTCETLGSQVVADSIRIAGPSATGFRPESAYTTPPDVLDPPEVVRMLAREYPEILREARIGGTVRLLVFISATGEVEETRIAASSGQIALDNAAMRVGNQIRFRPARRGDCPVPVWNVLPLSFQVR